MASTAAERDQSHAPREVLLAELAKPVRDFLRTESGSAGLLVLATAIALFWANSPWSDSYFDLLNTEISVDIGSRGLSMDLLHWINDGLMVIFFFVIGLELRHEISVGDLRQKRRLIAPALGGVGGLVVPALLYLLVNPSGEAVKGWGVVIGTDTAFLLGALALVGPRTSMRLRVFLLSMTIADDLMAVAIIGIVYSDSIDLWMVLIASICLGIIALLGRWRAWQVLAYLAVGMVAWLATLESGLHPSIIGMLAGILVISHPPRRDALDRAARLFKAFRQSPGPSTRQSARLGLQRAVPMNERLQEMLHPWTSFVIVPVFAMANAGVDLRGGVLGDALSSPITWGVILGLVVGKPLGVSIAAIGGAKLGLGELPRGLGPGQIVAGGALSGMGFSVSLLIAALAFESQPVMRQEAIVGVLLACILSPAVGWVIFRVAEHVLGERPAVRAMNLDQEPIPGRDHIRGPIAAPLTLVEYGDFECPFCGTATSVIDDLEDRFGTDLRYVFRHLPLADVHPHAELAAEAAEAAAEQGKFWEMHNILFRHQDELELEDLVGYASAIDIDVEEFTRALTEGRFSERVREDVSSAEASGARSTPTFYVNGRRHIGPWDSETLGRALESARRRLIAEQAARPVAAGPAPEVS